MMHQDDPGKMCDAAEGTLLLDTARANILQSLAASLTWFDPELIVVQRYKSWDAASLGSVLVTPPLVDAYGITLTCPVFSSNGLFGPSSS